MIRELVKKALRRGANVEVFLDGDDLGYRIVGFYKSGTVRLKMEEEKCIALARYGERTEIEEWDDLVRLNYKWWKSSKERHLGWSRPEDAFIDDFDRLGLEWLK